MKKWLKCGSAAIAVAMLASMALTGCGDEPASSGGSTTGESTAAEENTSPLKVSATLQSYGVDDEASQVHQAWLEMMNEKLGRELQLEIDYIPSGEYAEKAKMLISSNDITDIFMIPFLYDWTTAANDGMFLDLAPYADSKLPNYMALVDQTIAGRDMMYTDDGEMYLIYEMTLPRFPADNGINSSNVSAYRYDIFEEHGIKIPETLDEVYEAAKQLKEIYPDKYPINTRWKKLDSIFYANHTYNNIYWNGEEYVLGLLEDAYKESLQFASKLYTEGLLDPEYLIETDDTIKSKALNDVNFMWLAEWFTSPGDYTRLANEEKIFAATFWPDNPKYGTCWQTIAANNVVDPSGFAQFVVSSQVEDVEGILDLINLQFDDEVIRLITWGIEDVTYTINEEGVPEFVDSIKNAPDMWAEGDKYGMRTSSKSRPGLQMSQDAKAFVDLAKNDYLYYEGELHVEPFEKSDYYLSMPYPDSEYIPPAFFGPKQQFTDDEQQFISKNMTAVYTYLNEMQSKFVQGEESFDNWDQFIEELYSMGDIDRVVEIYNEAVDRYYAEKEAE